MKPHPPPGVPVEAADPGRIEKVKDLLHSLANTVSAMKIFPNEHATVAGFVDMLAGKFTDLLAVCQKLQIGVEEYSFTFEGKPVYTDEVAIKSLPFFFYKDGLHVLFFYQGLERHEILEFLELIKAETQKPAEDCDIVASLWERDFPNIQYYAPDEFLESRILAESHESRTVKDLTSLPDELACETIEVRVDVSKFSQGRIELTPDDREEVQKGSALAEEEPAAGGTGPAEDPVRAGATVPRDPTLTEADLHSLETMIRANRTSSPEEEYVSLMVEIIFLEESPSSCRASFDALLEYHFDQLQRGRFDIAVLIIQKVHELGRHLSGVPEKSVMLEAFLKRTVDPKMIEAIKILLAGKKPLDWESLLGFFRLLGPQAIGLAADLFDVAPDGEARNKVLAFIADAGGANPGLLASLADNARPGLALEIVGILSRIPGKRGIPHLSAFLNMQSRDVKLEAVHVLGRTRDETSNSILLGFLKDRDEEVRIQAAMMLDPVEAGSRVRQVVREASERDFLKKSLKEKEAVLSFLGRTRSAEALAFLSRVLRRAPLFASKRALEMRLAAVAGLESMGTGEAQAVLQKGAIGRTKAVRKACASALVRLPPAGGAGT